MCEQTNTRHHGWVGRCATTFELPPAARYTQLLRGIAESCFSMHVFFWGGGWETPPRLHAHRDSRIYGPQERITWGTGSPLQATTLTAWRTFKRSILRRESKVTAPCKTAQLLVNYADRSVTHKIALVAGPSALKPTPVTLDPKPKFVTLCSKPKPLNPTRLASSQSPFPSKAPRVSTAGSCVPPSGRSALHSGVLVSD